MTAEDLAHLIQQLEALTAAFDEPLQQLEIARRDRLDIHAIRTSNYLGTMLWNARSALTHAREMEKNLCPKNT